MLKYSLMLAMKARPRPQKLHELGSFLELCSYYRRFEPNFATAAANLHELTKKSSVYRWIEEQEEKAFQIWKRLLCTVPVLSYPVAGEKFVLHTDASGYGIVGMLSQVVNAVWKVIGY
ncbi:Retrovirus-related Pol polyprotein from transposon 17.6 [Eumeta japonica]|uniref:RNA-directed DNA polymerase n=1 Tax=Eumeta variegata TaxID=151549 RepID=A0A4C1SL93_EUMVA|nr:Retrovirus-related Pol polyprotein from transposon 17.6 [Eumeta japonica]